MVAYLGPITTRLTGVTGAGVSALQAFIGVGSFLGIAVGGIAANRKVVRLGSMAAFALMTFDLGAYCGPSVFLQRRVVSVKNPSYIHHATASVSE
jgi:predicted MFS family arabinose efflux permease